MAKYIPQRLFLISLILSASLAHSQHFSWIKGHATANHGAVFGPIGMALATNNPGARSEAARWQDTQDNFWMFGGYGYDGNGTGNLGLLNDLWKYNVGSNNWTWVSGASVFLQLGIYGTQGVPSTTNCPGARALAVTWIDGAGNLWLFGGYGYGTGLAQGYLNDLWKFNVTTLEWTWISGANIIDQTGTYGTMGTPAPTNVPGARSGAVSWKDGSGNCWLMGGRGLTTNSAAVGALNDLWKYNPLNNEWTWINGTNLLDQNGVYGTMGTPAATNMPGGREKATGWLDNNGNYWLYSGSGFDYTSIAPGLLNDLWKYNAASNEWTWTRGDNTTNHVGLYGTTGVGSPTNEPGSRMGATMWVDVVGNVWLFGGQGYPALSLNLGSLNDLWKYNVATNEWTWIKGSSMTDQPGAYGTLGLPNPNNIPGARQLMTSWIDTGNNLWLFGGVGQAGSGSSPLFGRLSDLWRYANCYVSPLTPYVTSSDSLICAGESVILAGNGSNNYSWSTGTFSATISVTPNATTSYTLYTADAANCVYSATYTQVVVPCLGLNNHNTGSQIDFYPNPSNGIFTVSGVTSGMLRIYAVSGNLVYEQQLSETTVINRQFPAGVYLYRVVNGSTTRQGKLIITDNQ